jgi:hypothetical protein
MEQIIKMVCSVCGRCLCKGDIYLIDAWYTTYKCTHCGEKKTLNSSDQIIYDEKCEN